MTQVNDIDADFLPQIHEIVRSIEKEIHEGTTGPPRVRESHDYHVKVQALKEKLDRIRSQANEIRGIGVTKEEQLKKLEQLATQLSQKREILSKYKYHCPIDGVRSHVD